MAQIIDTDITIKSNNIPIKGIYTTVDVIADGRCFFGSVALADRINNGEPYSNELTNDIISNLNNWIQTNLINIVEKSPPDCTIIQAVASYARLLLTKSVPESKSKTDDKVMTPENDTFVQISMEIDDTFPEKLTTCPYESSVSEEEIQNLLRNDTFQKYQAQFVSFCNAFIEKKNERYEYAEPEVITHILSKTLRKNICVVDNNYDTVQTYYSNYDEGNTLPTIYVKKLKMAHYHALIPAENIPVDQLSHVRSAPDSPISLRIKYERCEKKDLPSTGWRGSYGSSKTNRIIGKDSSDTENVVSKVNKTISEKSDFSNYQLIDENAVKVIDAGGNEVSRDNLNRAKDKWYFLVNLKEKQNSRKGGGKYTKNRLLRRLTQRKKTKRRRNKKRKSKKQH